MREEGLRMDGESACGARKRSHTRARKRSHTRVMRGVGRTFPWPQGIRFPTTRGAIRAMVPLL